LLARDAEVAGNRLQNIGLSSARVSIQSAHIVVDLPRLEPSHLEHVRRLLVRGGQLEFREVDSGAPYKMQLNQFVTDNQARFPEVILAAENWQSFSGQPQSDTYLKARNSAALTRLLAALPAELAVPADREILFEQTTRVGEDGEPRDEKWFRTYYLMREPILTGQSVTEAEIFYDQTQRPEVSLVFDDAGTARFSDFTASHVGKRLAIVFEDAVMSAPQIEGRIADGRARITLGSFSDPATLKQEALDLVTVLRVGAMPVPLRIEREDPLD
jgi:preprotein translocase subunit SecD